MQPLTTKDQVEYRRQLVFQYLSKGKTQREIATILQLDESTISRDVAYLREQASEQLKVHINETLPLEYQKCLIGLSEVLKTAWDTAEKTADEKTKLQALQIARDVYNTKMDLLTKAEVLDDAVRFVQQAKNKVAGLNPAETGEKEHDIQGSTEANEQKQYNKAF